ncbi:sarcosine oxidase subunit delta [Algicella marina]|uniref:Sarcosine oxidase subunit delta n=1 Tax=Algicella marina TaxID=2683284 RepID=A0A6P1SY46_9RHOB|nr:sarcosine oxidase subunit delta [Algicella marina]QHQ35604.1 sarcosine oxidase subunit delta [Algicella marina]
MRIDCPICGERDLREFSYLGSAALLARPSGDAGTAAFHEYLHVRENPAGPNAELWHHNLGCSAWLHVVRDTRNHAISSVALAAEVQR